MRCSMMEPITTTFCNNTESNVTGKSLATVPFQFVHLSTNHLAVKIEDRFEANAELAGIIVLDDNGDLLGMISRKRFMELYSKPFRKDLYNKKPVKLLVKYGFDEPLCLDGTTGIEQAAQLALSRNQELVYEPVVVRDTVGHTFRLVEMHTLLMALAKEFEAQNEHLRDMLSRVRQLEGIISICMYCKKIRNDTHSWEQLEAYLSNHSEAQFSHALCPECFEAQMKELKP